MSHVIVEDVAKTYESRSGPIAVLGGVSFTARRGEVIAFCGPSGCGKTTLLRIVAGLVVPERGDVTVDGKRVAGCGRDRAFLFQNYALFPWLSARRNIEFGLKASAAVPRRNVREQASQWLSRIGLEAYGDLYPSELSGGMQQRVALARTLAVRPQVALLDEPFASLDALTRAATHDLVQLLLVEEGMTALLVTHDPVEAAFLADRVVVFTPRPARTVGEVVIGLPRPRLRRQLRDPSLSALVADIEQLLAA